MLFDRLSPSPCLLSCSDLTISSRVIKDRVWKTTGPEYIPTTMVARTTSDPPWHRSDPVTPASQALLEAILRRQSQPSFTHKAESSNSQALRRLILDPRVLEASHWICPPLFWRRFQTHTPPRKHEHLQLPLFRSLNFSKYFYIYILIPNGIPCL